MFIIASSLIRSATQKMKAPLIVLALVGLSSASVIPYGVKVGLSLPEATHPIQSLYHSQDVLGQYSYGYATPTSAKNEVKTADGVTKGGYSYIDTNGILQTVNYVADPIHGFRVAATNLPQDLPEVAYAKAKHLADYENIKADHALRVQYSNPIAVPHNQVPVVPLVALPQPVQDLPEVVKARNEHLAAVHLATITAGVAPQPVQDLPEVVKARAQHLAAVEEIKLRNAAINQATALSPIPDDFSGTVVPIQTLAVQAVPAVHLTQSYAPISSQHHSQDIYGQYSYGYVEPYSSKSETKGADGVTRGGYSYIDANGVLQTVHYTADAVHGFRVAASNLPVAPHLVH